jgi:hypothetical protein
LATLILILAGLIIAALGFEIGTAWPWHAGQLLGWTGIVISALAAIRQYFEQRSFTYDFSEQSWKPSGDELVLEIPKTEHRKGRTPADPTVYQANDSGGYVPVECGVDVTSSGSVRIWIRGKPFSGRVVIK